jgi:hypothetical protein
MLVTALQYLNEYGWAVFPCGKNKKPLVEWEKYQHRRPTEKEINQWWGLSYPNANIGIVTGKLSGLTVIDIDSEAGDEALWELLPEDFETVQVRTPSGGSHYYCRYAEGTRNAAGWIKDCDLRSEGGFIIAPPSYGDYEKKGIHIRGSWAWVSGPENKMATLPDEIRKKLSKGGPAGSSRPPTEGLTFTSGTRNENLFTVANALLKGGMHEYDAKLVLKILAMNCDPPYSLKEAGRTAQSALDRQSRQKGEIVDLFREWIEGDTGLFLLKDAYFDLNITDRRGKQALSNAATRLVKEGILKKTEKRGGYRILDTGTDTIDFMKASDEEINLIWPLGVHHYFKLLPKNICVIAGEQDAGKTAYLLALAHMNLRKHEIHYFSSEMGPEEFKSRLRGFQPDTKLSDWNKYDFFPSERDSNFADVIKPDAINIIDYLEIDGAEGREFWRVGGMLKDIRDRLNNGAAIVAIQKNPDTKEGHNLGLGGFRGLEKPRLYMSMSGQARSGINRLKLEKVKNWRDEGFNPNGLQIIFKLIQGCRFREDGEWHHKNIGGE